MSIYDIRDKFMESLGELDNDVIAPIINPFFMGGPRWPDLRQSWRIVNKPNSTIIFSDGLSDPFTDGSGPLGYKVEVCAETPKIITLSNAPSSFLLNLVYNISQQIAEFGNIYELIEKHGTISMVISEVPLPDNWKSEDGLGCVLIGFKTKDIPSRINVGSDYIKILVIKLLHPKERAYIEVGNDIANQRVKLISMFNGNHICDLDRDSVI